MIESISEAKVEYFEYTDSVSTDILKSEMLKKLTEAPEAPDLTYITKVAQTQFRLKGIQSEVEKNIAMIIKINYE